MPDNPSERRPRGHRLRSRFVQAALLLLAYYLVPVREAFGTLDQLVHAGLALIVFVVLVAWFTHEVVRQTSRSATQVNQDVLLLLVVGGLVVFALADLAVARTWPSEFDSLQTKTDALYFAVTTGVTVGFGDVHAQGQVARGLVIVQMLFNVVVLARAAQTLVATRTAQHAPEQDG